LTEYNEQYGNKKPTLLATRVQLVKAWPNQTQPTKLQWPTF